jgi:hypothetical protein
MYFTVDVTYILAAFNIAKSNLDEGEPKGQISYEVVSAPHDILDENGLMDLWGVQVIQMTFTITADVYQELGRLVLKEGLMVVIHEANHTFYSKQTRAAFIQRYAVTFDRSVRASIDRVAILHGEVLTFRSWNKMGSPRGHMETAIMLHHQSSVGCILEPKASGPRYQPGNASFYVR